MNQFCNSNEIRIFSKYCKNIESYKKDAIIKLVNIFKDIQLKAINGEHETFVPFYDPYVYTFLVDMGFKCEITIMKEGMHVSWQQ